MDSCWSASSVSSLNVWNVVVGDGLLRGTVNSSGALITLSVEEIAGIETSLGGNPPYLLFFLLVSDECRLSSIYNAS